MVRTLVLCLCLAVASTARAQASNASGRVASVVGTVTVHRGPEAQPVKAGAELVEGDIVKTGANSTARLLMRDKGVLDLGPGSTLAIRTYKVEPQRRSRVASLQLFVGRVWARVTKAVGNDSSYEVTTTNAVAGVRGTEFVVNVDESGATEVTVVEGSVEVSSGGAPEGTRLGALQRGSVSQEGGGVTVQEVTPEEIEKLASSVRAEAGAGDAAPPSDAAGQPGSPTPGQEQPPEQAPQQESVPLEEAPPPELPPLDLDPGAGSGRVRGHVEVKD